MKEDFGTMSAGVRSDAATGDQRAASVEGRHTPGPWHIDIEEIVAVRDRGEGRVCVCGNLRGPHGINGRRPADEVAANARLIAAAPDLLDALKRLRAKYSRCARLHGNDEETVNISVDFVDAAIAKAEGQTRPNDDGAERGRARLSRETT